VFLGHLVSFWIVLGALEIFFFFISLSKPSQNPDAKNGLIIGTNRLYFEHLEWGDQTPTNEIDIP